MQGTLARLHSDALELVASMLRDVIGTDREPGVIAKLREQIIDMKLDVGEVDMLVRELLEYARGG